MHKVFWLVFACVFLAACEPGSEAPEYDPARDYFSYANTDEFITRELYLNLDVDFQAQELQGQAVLLMHRLDPAAQRVVLDTRGLLVSAVYLLHAEQDQALDWAIGDPDPVLGEALTIELPQDFQPRGPFYFVL